MRDSKMNFFFFFFFFFVVVVVVVVVVVDTYWCAAKQRAIHGKRRFFLEINSKTANSYGVLAI